MSTINKSGETRAGQASAPTPTPEPSDGRMTRRQVLVLVLLLGAQFTLAVDFSIMNVAVPVIGRELGFAQENLQWIATAFALSAAGFSLLFGRVADLIGARKVFLAGLALLTVSSLLGGMVDAAGPLLAARVAQGLATAMVTPAGLALLTTSFPEGPLRDRALGLNGAMLSAGFTCGAIVGGLLTDALSWRWGFYINVPIGILLIVVAPMLLAKSEPRRGGKLDIPGAITVSAGLIALVYGISAAGERGWTNPTALISLAVGVVLLIAFGFIELRAPEPLAPLRILSRRTVTWGNIGGAVTFIGFTAMIFLLTLYLQDVLGYSAMATGLTFGVLGVGAFLGGVTAPRWIGVFGSSHAVLVAGLLAQGITVGALFFAGDGRGWLYAVLGLAFLSSYAHVVAIVGFMVTATSGLPNEQQGLATGITTLTQQVSITVGIPIMSAVAVAQIRAMEGATAKAATLHGINVAILVNGLLLVGVALLVALFVKRRAAAASD
ncbi:MFS transporter [Streptomyces sp. NPDC054975]